MRLLASLACAVALLSAQPRPATDSFVPVGVWYGGGTARAPMLSSDPARDREAWRRDLQAIKSLGFNSIKCWVDWATTEAERGVYRFDALEQLLDLADETGLRAIVQIYTDSAPQWVGAAFPDASFVTERGERIGSQAAPGFCLDHAGVRAAVERFIAGVSQRARNHASLVALDVWSEPHLVNWAWFNAPAEFCYCPNTQAKFREWLSKKYGTLEALNRAWYRTFTKWEEVEPPRYGTILSYTDFIDWKTFIPDKLRDDLKMKADATRATFRAPATLGRSAAAAPPAPSGPPAFVTSHSDAPAVLLSPLSGYGNPDDWWMSQVVDAYGTSVYPKHASSSAPWSPTRLAAGLDGIRSAARDKGWWVGELQAGQGATGVKVGTPVTGADLRLWGWTALSRGARAISYYAWYPMSSGYESNGYGMIELDGTITDRAKAAGQFARVVDRHRALFSALRPEPSQVAILYNRLSYLAGGNTVGPGQTARNALQGAYRALFERNIQADFVHPDEILAGRAIAYRLIYLPYPVMLPQPVANALKDYVRQGGTLVSEARVASNDERGLAASRIPGFGLDEVFGCREKGLHSPDKVEMVAEASLPGPLAPLSGQKLRGSVCAEHLEVTNPEAQVLARFAEAAATASAGAAGDPAIVASRFGKGRAVLIGSFPAALYEQEQDAATGRLLQALAAWAGVEPSIGINGAAGLVEARLLESPAALLLVAINHGESPQEVELTLPASLRALPAENLETGARVALDAGQDRPVLRHRFEARDVLAVAFSRPTAVSFRARWSRPTK